MAEKVKIVIEVDSKTGIANMKKFGVSGDKVTSNMKRQEMAAKSLTGSLKGVIVALGGFVALRMASEAVMGFVKAASDLEEVTSKFNVVFGKQRDVVKKWAETLVDSYAMSTIESLKYLASVQDLLKPMGMQSESAAKLSFEIVKLSADLGSFNNLPTAQVMGDIQSALVGNYETMKKYGVVINATIVQEKALAMGLASTKDELTVAHKAFAAYKLMVKGSSDAIGDMARTSDEYANQMKKLNANIEDLRTTMGENLLPIATKVVTQFNNWIKTNETLINQEVKEYVDGISEGLKGLMGIYNSLPEGVVGAAGVGIVGRIISGSTPIGVLTGALVLLNEQLKVTGLNLTSLPSKFKSLSGIQMNLWDSLIGKKDWRTGADLTTGGIKDSWMGRPLSSAVTEQTPSVTAQPPGRGEVESYQQITNELLGANALRAEKILEFDMIQAGLLAEQQMEQAQASLETKSQLEIYMAGQLYHDLEAMRWQHHTTMKRVAQEEQAMQMTRLGIYQSVAAGVANTFLQISQAGGKQSKAAFKLYQGFAMAEAGISAAKAIIMALASPPGPPWSFAIAGITGAMAAVQIGLIAGAKPPSYDQGGISTTPGMYYAGVPEAHVPLKSGAIPVNLGGGGGGDTFININMDNPVFQDLETQQAVFAEIAERIAPNAVVRAYDNDHTIRGRIRSRA